MDVSLEEESSCGDDLESVVTIQSMIYHCGKLT